MESESVEGVAKSCGAKTKRQGEKRGEERGREGQQLRPSATCEFETVRKI